MIKITKKVSDHRFFKDHLHKKPRIFNRVEKTFRTRDSAKKQAKIIKKEGKLYRIVERKYGFHLYYRNRGYSFTWESNIGQTKR